MSVVTKLVKVGLINKAIEIARKPENQQRAKQALQSVMEKRKQPKTG